MSFWKFRIPIEGTLVSEACETRMDARFELVRQFGEIAYKAEIWKVGEGQPADDKDDNLVRIHQPPLLQDDDEDKHDDGQQPAEN